MCAICIGINTTAVDILQVPVKYKFDLAVCNVRGRIAFIFSRGCICLNQNISKAGRNC